MTLYEWREDGNSKLIDFKFISSKLSLTSLNSHFYQYRNDSGGISCRKYPILNNRDIISLNENGQCLVFYSESYLFVIDLDHPNQIKRKQELRDFKINSITK